MSLPAPALVVDVIIPAYNEGPSIGRVIRDIPAGLVRSVIVGNNGSTDDTAAQARQAGAIVVNAPKRGYGSACLAAMAYIDSLAADQQPDAVAFIDGDYADYPGELPLLLAPLAHGFDLVIGSRASGHALPGSLTLPQRFGNWLATRMIRGLYGFAFTDLGPFRVIRWPKLKLLAMQDPAYGWTVEMQIKAVKKGLRCTEVPVSYRPRIGQSKVSGTVKGSILAGYTILKTILKSR